MQDNYAMQNMLQILTRSSKLQHEISRSVKCNTPHGDLTNTTNGEKINK